MSLNDELEEEFDDFHIQPPPLCHQRSMDVYHSDDDSSPPVYRSLSVAGPSSAHDWYDEYKEPPRWRSASLPLDQDPIEAAWSSCEASPVYRSASLFDPAGGCGVGFPSFRHDVCTVEVCPVTVSAVNVSTSRPPAIPASNPFHFELPSELFDMVLQLLPCHPDLFCAMRTCRLWRDAAHANCMRRRRHVQPGHDALLHAVASAGPGDTLVLASGVHTLSKELCLDQPIRLLGPSDPLSAAAVLCSFCHVVLRTRCVTTLAGLTLCRLGDEIGYPNAVVFAEAGKLSVEACRITCGGAAATVQEALCAFDGAPRPGEPWTAELPLFSRLETSADEQRLDRPQSGVWVGAAATVRMSRCTISCTLGPGIKIYRGQVEAEDSTIAFSCRGANVVANGGRVRLLRNEIRGAVGDGISAWNNAHMDVTSNHIHFNSGCGVAINSGGGRVRIQGNTLVDNSKAAIWFVTSQMQQAVLHENEYDRNGGGDVQGLQQSSRRSRADWVIPRHTVPASPQSNHSGEIP